MKVLNTMDEGWFVLLERAHEHWEVWDKRTDRLIHQVKGRKFACLEAWQWAKKQEDLDAKAVS